MRYISIVSPMHTTLSLFKMTIKGF